MFGFQAGIGYGTAYKSKITPALEGYYLKKITPRLYIGGSVFFQRYSFLNTLIKDTTNLNYGNVLSISQRSSYLFFCPKIDFGFGYHKYIHANLSIGPGVYMGGNQYTYEYQPFWTNASGYSYGADTASTNTSYNIPKVIFRVGAGISERLPTYRYWNIILSQEFSYIPGYIGESNANLGTPALRTSYISFQVGIMHKYPQVFVEY
jgi:hypothetical protein